MRPEVVAVLELELVLARFLHRHSQRHAFGLGAPGDVSPELLVNQHAGRVGWRARSESPGVGIEDDPLDVDDARPYVGGDRLGGPEQIVLERTAVIEGHQVERPVVPERHQHASRFQPSGR